MDSLVRAAGAPPPPLTSAVVVVGRAVDSGNIVQASVAALPHVTQLVSDFLDHSTFQFWNFARACKRRHLALLRRLAARGGESAGSDTKERAREVGRGLAAAVKRDNLNMIECLHACCPRANTRLAMETGSRFGRLALLQWITNNFECVAWDSELVRLAAQYGHLETLKWFWLHPQSSSFSDHDAINTIIFAARNGHLAMVKWLNEQQPWVRDDFANDRFEYALRHAVLRGHLDVAEYLAQNGISQLSGIILSRIADESQDTAMVEWIRDLLQQCNGSRDTQARVGSK